VTVCVVDEVLAQAGSRAMIFSAFLPITARLPFHLFFGNFFSYILFILNFG